MPMPPDPRRFKLILTYDITPAVQDSYFQFMLGELVPAVQAMGLQMSGAWHTAYGHYPVRLVEFVAEDHDALAAVLETPTWFDMETRLKSYVTNYSRKIVRLRDDQFQF
jgi:hypothetical protein